MSEDKPYIDRNKLDALLRWYMQEVGKNLIAALIVNREGLMIDSITKSKSKEEDQKFIGAFSALVELILRKITQEFELGRFGAGTFDTDLYRFIFCEAGPELVFITVLDSEASVDPYFPYSYLAAEKVARIFDGRTVSPVIPKLRASPDQRLIRKKINQFQKIDTKAGDYIYKLILGGEEAVGKTSLVHRFVDNTFGVDYKPTIGTQIMKKEFHFKGLSSSIRFSIWDLGGQSQFKRVRKAYTEMSDAGMIVFDVTRRDTFDKIIEWHAEFTEKAPNVLLILVGNKIDLEEARVVSRTEGIDLANKLGAPYMETSAKTGENVIDAFRVIALHLIQQYIQAEDI